MNENEIAHLVVDASFQIHNALGPGLLETVYETVLNHELKKRNLNVKCQVPVPVTWDDIRLDEGYRVDLLVEDKVIVEVKAIEKTMPVHGRQLLTYLRLTNKRLGLLINFGEEFIRNGIKRVANGLPEE